MDEIGVEPIRIELIFTAYKTVALTIVLRLRTGNGNRVRTSGLEDRYASCYTTPAYKVIDEP